MEKEIKRGDLYWINMGDSVGAEIMGHRPGVIVSSNRGNEISQLVLVAYTTTKPKYGIVNVPIEASGKRSYVLCNQVSMVDKVRLIQYMGTLTEEEMVAVDRGLCVALSLTPQKEDDFEEKRMLEEEIASLNAQIASKKDSGIAVAVERDMWKKMYEKAMEMLVQAKMSEPTVEEESEPTVEINTCTDLELRSIGCTPTIIHHIIANRPYKSVDDLKTLPRMTKIAFGLIKNRVCCIPVLELKEKKKKPSKKVNVNTATVEEMVSGLGIGKETAEMIRAYRNKHGRFESVEDLLNVPRFGKGCMKKYGSKVEV